MISPFVFSIIAVSIFSCISLTFSYVILDFLCVHPFSDGNGRMSRLLTLLLLYKNDYVIGKSADPSPNRIVVEQSESPSLFFLIETCKNLNATQLARLTAYAKTLSDVILDDEK